MAYAAPVVAVGASNVTISNPGTASFDGTTVTAGQRVLLVNQTTPSQNGVWIWNALHTAMSRPVLNQDQYQHNNTLDNNTLIPVQQGTVYASSVWGVSPATLVVVDSATTGTHQLTRVNLPPVRARFATPGTNLNLANTFTTIDGSVTVVGNGAAGSDIILVKDQNTRSQNGLYWANSSGPMARADEPLYPTRTVQVSGGNVMAHTVWELATLGAIVVGTSSLDFSRQIVRANVKDFGALGNGATDDSGAIVLAYNSTTVTSGALIFPAGTYPVTGQSLTVPSNVQVTFEEGASIAPSARRNVTIQGRVTSHPTQAIFAGSGYSTVPVAVPSGAPSVTVSVDNPLGPFSCALRLPTGSISPTITMTNMGAGYTSTPTVTFSGHPMTDPLGSVTATGTAIVAGGMVTSVTVTNIGTGYASAPTITFSGGGPTTPATATCVLASPGDVGTFQFQYSLNGGTFYYQPIQTISGTHSYALPGTGLTVTFATGMYTAGTDTYTWTSNPAVQLTAVANDRFSVKWWGATGNGTSDDTNAIQSAIWAAASTGASVFFPPGTYKTTSPLILPGSVILQGTGRPLATTSGTQIKVAHNGIGIIHQAGTVPDAVNGCSGLRDLGMTAAATFTPLAAVQLICVSYTTIQDCDIDSFQYGVVLDATELCTIQRCAFANPPATNNVIGSIYLTNGETWTRGQLSGATNVNAIRDCQFNSERTAIIDDGGSFLEITSCNFNAQSINIIVMSGRSGARVSTSNLEAPGKQVKFDYQSYLPSLATGQIQGVGQSTFVHFSECGTLEFNIVSLAGLNLDRCQMGAAPVTGGIVAASIRAHDCVYSGTFFDTWPTIGALDATGGPDHARIQAASGPPTAITTGWRVGDIVWNTAPTAGGVIGWVCTTAGVINVNAGTWKTFGAIAP